MPCRVGASHSSSRNDSVSRHHVHVLVATSVESTDECATEFQRRAEHGPPLIAIQHERAVVGTEEKEQPTRRELSGPATFLSNRAHIRAIGCPLQDLLLPSGRCVVPAIRGHYNVRTGIRPGAFDGWSQRHDRNGYDVAILLCRLDDHSGSVEPRASSRPRTFFERFRYRSESPGR